VCKSFSALIWVESYSIVLIEREEKAACVFFFSILQLRNGG